jgi:hypothetical protein
LSLNNLALLLYSQGDYDGARPLCERALAIFEKVLGAEHPDTKGSAATAAVVLEALGRADTAAALRARFGLVRETPASARQSQASVEKGRGEHSPRRAGLDARGRA